MPRQARIEAMYASVVGSSAPWRQAASQVRPGDAALFDQVQRSTLEGRAPGTWRSYVYPWEQFQRWCSQRDPPYQCLPAEPVVVAMFLQHVALSASTYAVVKTASAAIFSAHRMAGVREAEIPTADPMCKAVRQAAQRVLGGMVLNRKEPLLLEELQALASLVGSTGASQWDLTIAAMACVGWAGFLRFSDMSVIEVGDVMMHDTHMALFLCTGKNDQFREGNVVLLARGATCACPVSLVQRLLDSGVGARGPRTPLFQGSVARGSTRQLSGAAITYAQARYWLAKYMAGVMGITQQQALARFGTHSLRVGGASAVGDLLAAEGISEQEFQQHGRWRSRDAMLVYIEGSQAKRLRVSQAMRY